MGATTSLSRQPSLLVWDDLDAVQQSLLGVASREQTLEHACASWSRSPHRPIDIQRTRVAAHWLVDRGLVGFYRVQDGYPDLATSEMTSVLGTNDYWNNTRAEAQAVGIFLTTEGEEVILGP